MISSPPTDLRLSELGTNVSLPLGLNVNPSTTSLPNFFLASVTPINFLL